ncbi:unnamed protein product [Parascedosporium putredinis]|uniref:Nudix hydrolase domain-containing protein n=1 Tax=Parascedosporium putredinis TaxID=1442378 RepID=A0A9P1M8R3_9PEZI|nr:unnamed protein product [Parascedosporium putredinis]CAI7990590.1 unnamed protein product [Parascedosporium putredinis]
MATATSSRTMESRTGRSKQRERLVAGVVPLTEDRKYVLLIQSARRKGWVLPKGGWESDEECTEAAEREAWEEAGIIDGSKALYRFYEATVTREETDWPERHKRERQWFTFKQAKEALSTRPELQEALERSTMKRH